MARIARVVDMPLDGAMASTRYYAAELGWTLVENKSDTTTLVFRKVRALSLRRTTFTIWFEPESPTQTQVAAFSKESFTLVDWGCGGRAIKKLFKALGAHLHNQPATP